MVLLAFVLVCLGAGGLGAIATTPEIPHWYHSLNKPTWTPPGAVFGPVWTMLYIMMAFAAWLVWRTAGFARARAALSLFAVQLALNIAWSWIFFAYHQPGWAFVELVALWSFIIATAILFFRIRAAAGWLMVPYVVWVTFAAMLNYAIWRMN